MEKKPGAEISEKHSPIEQVRRPTPDNFDLYLPWACCELGLYIDILLIRIKHNEYVNAMTDRSRASKGRTKRKNAVSKIDIGSDEDAKENVISPVSDEKHVTIYTVYDNSNNLVHLKFDKNIKIPSQLLQIISLFVQFQVHLTCITVNRGLSKASLYELYKLIRLSQINNVCLDNTVIPDANYDILLNCGIKQLSLARCYIDDDILRKISSKLSYPLVASKTLSILNLASNKITDSGAKYLAEMLRSNRQLVYLNLADNHLTDEGSKAIFDVLIEFILSDEELVSYKCRFMQYWNEKQNNSTIERPIEEKKTRKKSGKLATPSDSSRKSKSEKDANLSKTTDLESFVDPFSTQNTTMISGKKCCYGNNSLAYLNLSYNNLSFFTVKMLLNVLETQMILNRKPRGLVNILIDGNYIPTSCNELNQIKFILETIIFDNSKYPPTKRKLTARPTYN